MTTATFGERLKARRLELGLTGRAMCLAAELPLDYADKLEKGARRPTDEVLAKLAPVLGVPLAQLRAWARAEGMDEEEQRYLWQDAASPLVRIEAAAREVHRLADEKRALVAGPKTPEAVQRAGEIDALLLALENLLEEEGAKLEAEKRLREKR